MNYEILKPQPFNLKETLNCGQCFRFEEGADGVFCGVVKNKLVKVKEDGEKLIFFNTTKDEFDAFLCDYFDLKRNYNEINNSIKGNELLTKIIESEKGIRILKQEPFEALISFIISANNNIPRIKKIVGALCESYGQKIEGGYTFPTAEALYTKTPEELNHLRAGFRAKYIIDAAKKVHSGEVNLDEIYSMPLDEAREKLKTILGVGDKVADCTLLFGFNKLDAFPKDVWIKRAMEKYFPNGLPQSAEKYMGIVQQYIFNYVRKNG